jgi:predicted transposase
MLRTLKVSLPADPALVQTAHAFNKACQIALDYGSQHKTCNKNILNRATYHQIRETLPHLPSALVQTARDQAAEILRRTGCVAAAKKRLSIRYDKRTFKFYPDQNRASLTTVCGRLNFFQALQLPRHLERHVHKRTAHHTRGKSIPKRPS